MFHLHSPRGTTPGTETTTHRCRYWPPASDASATSLPDRYYLPICIARYDVVIKVALLRDAARRGR